MRITTKQLIGDDRKLITHGDIATYIYGKMNYIDTVNIPRKNFTAYLRKVCW